MRSYRLLLSLLALSLIAALAPPASAENPPPKAQTNAIVNDDEFGYALVIVACTGTAPPREAAQVKVECDIYDSSGKPSIHRERTFSTTGAAPGGVCFLAGQGMKMPVEYCTTVTVLYRDLTTQSHQDCRHAGEGLPPHNPPESRTPELTDCFSILDTPV